MASDGITRRDFVGTALAASVAGAVPLEARLVADSEASGRRRLYWGDLHNHNAVGYAKGSLERSIELAREHLDFFAFTGHASWHDMPKMPGDRHMKWVRGFEVHTNHWPKTQALIRAANSDDFVAFLGYEWHSSTFGDYCLIFPEDRAELFLPDHVEKLLDYADAAGALAIPHHLGYEQGWRGANWEHYRRGVSPIVEIFSEHGCSETARAPFPYLRHSMGGRSTKNLIDRQLAQGVRFGFVASSDDHRGYPGAYGEGIVGVWADGKNRAALLDALRARRTYAATGDRIVLEVSVNGQPMGSELAEESDREIDVRVEAQDAIEVVELVKNGRVVRRHFPDDDVQGPLELPGRAKVRLQYGWGPWAALNLGRICHWDARIAIQGGRFLRAWPCFQSAPFDEELRDRLEFVSDSELHLVSHTTREDCFGEDPTKALICELDAGADAELTVRLRKPIDQVVRARLVDLASDNVVTFTGTFTSESFILHRLVGPSEYAASIRWHDRRSADETGADFYYVRVRQHNAQMAWSSPVWVG